MQASNRSAREIARIFSDGDGDISPEYQRGSVWTEDQRIALVRSWLMGVPIPSIVINDRIFGAWPNDKRGPSGGYAYSAIDGKQRIETAIAWFGGEFAVPASWFAPGDVEVTEETEDGPYVRYTGLAIAERPADRDLARRLVGCGGGCREAERCKHDDRPHGFFFSTASAGNSSQTGLLVCQCCGQVGQSSIQASWKIAKRILAPSMTAPVRLTS